MLRHAEKVTCPDCGQSFLVLDIEDNATVQSMPISCPHCGRTVRPSLYRIGEEWLKRMLNHPKR